MRKRAATSSESEEEQLTCNICSKPQEHARRLREHMRKVHGRARSPCPRCLQICSTANNERRHNECCRESQPRAPPGVLQEDPQTEVLGEMQEEGLP